MIIADPIIAVRDVKVSSKWYQVLFDCSDMHGGDHFAILTDARSEVLLCLHALEVDSHPTMMNQSTPTGNGLILYFRTDALEKIRKNADKLDAHIEEDIHQNANSHQTEFSLRDPDGYYLTISKYHEYEG